MKFKACVHYFRIFYQKKIASYENVFSIIEKVPFILKTFKCLYFPLPLFFPLPTFAEFIQETD